VQERIALAYGIDADVVPAPVAMPTRTAESQPVPQVQRWLTESGAAGCDGAFYLCVSRLLAYKNVEQVVRAFAGSDRRLVVVGRGPEADRIRQIKTPNVLMVADLTDSQLGWLYRHSRATLAASYEDYGLTPIEAGTWGRPSVVLRWGGFLDTVEEGITGMYFDRPEPAAIANALDRFEETVFDPDKIRAHVEQFSEKRFAETLYAAVDDVIEMRR
jgi:glycosyltransferase involved in cell wall biosynthesis